jgi:hypothetical protein
MPVADDQFDVALNGQVVKCRSLQDAVAVKAAADILSHSDPTPYKPDHLARLADVLLRYGQLRAADALIRRKGEP